MREPEAEVGRSMGDSVGLAWYLFERDGLRFVTHGGSTNGQQALFVACPEERFAFAVLTNHADGAALASELRDHLLRLVGVEPPQESRIELPEDRLAAYAGSYDAALTRTDVVLEDGSPVLTMTPKGGFPTPDSPPMPGPPPTRVAFERADAIVALDEPLEGARGDFLRGPRGE